MCIFIRLCRYVNSGARMNPIEFGGQRSKVNIIMGIIGKCWMQGDATLCIVWFQRIHKWKFASPYWKLVFFSTLLSRSKFSRQLEGSSTGTAFKWYLITGTTPKSHLRSHRTRHIPIMIRPDTNVWHRPHISAQSEIKTHRNWINCMRLTSPKAHLSASVRTPGV